MVMLSLALACSSGKPTSDGLPNIQTEAQTEAQDEPEPAPTRPRLGQGPVDKVGVMLTTRAVKRGTWLSEEDLKMTWVEQRFLPPGVFSSPERVVGRIVSADLMKDEIVREERLADPEKGGLASRIPMGMRAIEVPRGDSPAQPGNYVDVWWTPPGEGARPCMLLQATFVLAATPDRLKLLVTPQQALDVLPAARSSSFRLTLRNDLDVNYTAGNGCP